jgi:hypothetical protein
VRATYHAHLIFVDFIVLIISDAYEKSLGPSLCVFFQPLMNVRISKRIFCSAVFVRRWTLSQGTATEINYTCLHTAFEGWKVRGGVHGLVLIWNMRNFLRD